MAGKVPNRNPVPVSDLASRILDPMLRRRAGISIGLVQSWDEIAGPRLARLSRPERIQWPRRLDEDDPFQPAVLVIACEGFNAVGRIRIVQKPVTAEKPRPRPVLRELSQAERKKLSGTVGPIEDEGLRAALERLGARVLGGKR